MSPRPEPPRTLSLRPTSPTTKQVQIANKVVRWYLANYYQRPEDLGVASMFCDPARVGAFAIAPGALASGDGEALFRLLIAMTMFQRRQDVQVLRILRGMRRSDARELTSARRLLNLADRTPCEHLRTTTALHGSCDLTKDPATKTGCCTRNPQVACHLKRHTVLLKRYGHFGKVPTSAALAIREAGATDLPALRDQVLKSVQDPLVRARALEDALSRSWRVSQKIAAMFLSAISNPDLSPAPWAEGVDWTHFVVIDSNVDLFLAAIEYRGSGTYDARRSFVQQIAHRIDLRTMENGVSSYNPRIVQQALYLFMSLTNRRQIASDCMHQGPQSCRNCPSPLSKICPARSRAVA